MDGLVLIEFRFAWKIHKSFINDVSLYVQSTNRHQIEWLGVDFSVFFYVFFIEKISIVFFFENY